LHASTAATATAATETAATPTAAAAAATGDAEAETIKKFLKQIKT